MLMAKFGSLPKSALARAYSTFAGAAALDVLDQANWAAGYAEFSKHSAKDESTADRARRIASASLKDVDPIRAVASSMLEVLESSLDGDAGASKTKLDDSSVLKLTDGGFIKRQGTSWKPVDAPAKNSRVVAVNATELGAIKSMDATGDRKGANQVIARANSRKQGITDSQQELAELNVKEKMLVSRIKNGANDSATTARKSELESTREAMSQTGAALEILRLAQEGTEIPSALAKQGRILPTGYVAAEDGTLRPSADRLVDSVKEAVDIAETLAENARHYHKKLDAMDELSRELKKEEASRPPNEARIKTLRTQLSRASMGAFASRELAVMNLKKLKASDRPIRKPEGSPFDGDSSTKKKKTKATELDRKVEKIRRGEPGKVRSKAELSDADVALSMNHQLKHIAPEQVAALIESFPPGQRKKARTVLAASSGFANMESLNSIRLALEPHMDSDLYTPGKGSLADNLSYVAEKRSFAGLDGVSDRSIFTTKVLTDGCVVILDDVVLAKIKEDGRFAQSLVDYNAVLLEPRGFNSGLNMFNAGTTESIRSKVSELLSRADALAEKAPKTPYEQLVTRVLDEMSRTVLDQANENLSQQLVPVDANKVVATSNKAIARQLNGDAGISEADITKALAGKNDDEAAMARELLAQRTEIQSNRQFAIDLAAKHRDILAQAAAKGIAPDKVFFFIPKSRKSYGMLAMAHRLATKTPANRYLDGTADLNARAKEAGPDSMLVIIDDVAGSGQSNYEAMLKITSYEGQVIFAPVISTERARIRFAADRPATDRNRWHYQPQKIAKALRESDFFKKLSIEQQKRLLTITGKLGYDKNGLSMAFPYMAPDNNNRFFAENFAKFFLFNRNQQAVK